MKRNRSVVLLLLVVVLPCTIAFKGTLSGPKVVFEAKLYDYGTIKRNSDGTCKFPFVNKGDGPLVITGVKAACGCTVPDYPKAPILPGESGNIKVVYNTKNVGSFTKTVNVTTNDPNNLTVTLTLTGKVIK